MSEEMVKRLKKEAKLFYVFHVFDVMYNYLKENDYILIAINSVVVIAFAFLYSQSYSSLDAIVTFVICCVLLFAVIGFAAWLLNFLSFFILWLLSRLGGYYNHVKNLLDLYDSMLKCD